jgi:ABC-type dipeptide/oligopeptide/nickel transport system permease subunit
MTKELFTKILSNKPLCLYLALAIVLIIVALTAHKLSPHDIYETDYSKILQSPSREYIFGTDYMGRCVFSRILQGTATTFKMTFSAVLIVFVLGSTLGIMAGYFGGVLNALVMRLADIMLAFPGIILAVAIAGIMGGGLQNAVIAIAAVTWPRYARLSRSLVLKEKRSFYVAAARVLGTGPFFMMIRHIFPNIISILVLSAVMDIGVITMELAGLSYLGLGAQPPTPEWGLMLAGGKTYFQSAPWLLAAPALAIFMVLVVWNLLGDKLRDVMDPKMAPSERQ